MYFDFAKHICKYWLQSIYISLHIDLYLLRIKELHGAKEYLEANGIFSDINKLQNTESTMFNLFCNENMLFSWDEMMRESRSYF